MNLIVNLLSDQTIPNLLFLKHYYSNGDQILFLSTQKMAQKGIANWLMSAFQLTHTSYSPDTLHQLILEPFDLHQMKTMLGSYDYAPYDRILVNVTGGTKTMSLVVYDFFQAQGADIYYLTGNQTQILKLFPERGQQDFTLGSEVSLEEYLIAYGYEVKRSHSANISDEYLTFFMDWFLSHKTEEEQTILDQLRENKRRDKGCVINEIEGLASFLQTIKYPIDYTIEKLPKLDVQFLTGEWFESYVARRITKALSLPVNTIDTGISLKKNGVSNEFDVLFILQNALYIIECKTYIISAEKPTLVLDTIYKVAALIKELGLYGNTSIATLNSETQLKKANLDRAKEMKINILHLEDLTSGKSVQHILNLTT